MDILVNSIRFLVIALLAIYEVYAFKKRKPLKGKLLPLFSLSFIALLLIILPFAGFIGAIIGIIVIELSLICSIIVVLGEIVIYLLGSERKKKRIFQLVYMFFLLVMIYFIGKTVY